MVANEWGMNNSPYLALTFKNGLEATTLLLANYIPMNMFKKQS